MEKNNMNEARKKKKMKIEGKEENMITEEMKTEILGSVENKKEKKNI